MTSRLLALLLLAVASATPATAQVVLEAIDRGWYEETGLHQPINDNYVVGDLYNTVTEHEYRNWFLFDPSGVTEPCSPRASCSTWRRTASRATARRNATSCSTSPGRCST